MGAHSGGGGGKSTCMVQGFYISRQMVQYHSHCSVGIEECKLKSLEQPLKTIIRKVCS